RNMDDLDRLPVEIELLLVVEYGSRQSVIRNRGFAARGRTHALKHITLGNQFSTLRRCWVDVAKDGTACLAQIFISVCMICMNLRVYDVPDGTIRQLIDGGQNF